LVLFFNPLTPEKARNIIETFQKERGIKMNCPKCGNELNPNMKFCAKCGTPVGQPAAPVAPQQPVQQKPVVPAQQKPVAPAPSKEMAQPEPKKPEKQKITNGLAEAFEFADAWLRYNDKT
jgi:hypothetical protein